MRVVFVDIGKGDSILVFDGEFAFMIDTGDGNRFLKLSSTLEKYHIKKLDALILTHPHWDHTGAYELLKNKIDIRDVYMPKCMIVKENASVFKFLKAEDELFVGTFSINVLAPCNKRYKNLNDYSIIIKLCFGSARFLFMGDATCLSETEILSRNYDLKCDVLKVGHHGQEDASCMSFLQAALPKYSIISTDDELSIKTEVIDRLLSINSEIYFTGRNGNIEFETDGTNILLRCEKSNEVFKQHLT